MITLTVKAFGLTVITIEIDLAELVRVEDVVAKVIEQPTLLDALTDHFTQRFVHRRLLRD